MGKAKEKGFSINVNMEEVKFGRMEREREK